jgi:outer membrane lipoprotein-sorting protein/peroxiredoxin
MLRTSLRHRLFVSLVFTAVFLSPMIAVAQSKPLDLAQVVAKLQERLQQAQGLSLDVEYRPPKGNPVMAKIMALRPNYYRVEMEHQSFYCDGTAAWQYFPLKAVYLPFHKDDKGMYIPLATGFEMYSPASQYKLDYKAVEEAEFEGKRVFALVSEPKDIPNLRSRIFIDPETWLPIGSDQKMLDDVTILVYKNVKTDRQFVPADFTWAPPKGAVDGTKIITDSPKPLQVGEIAPDFNLPLANGKNISLGDALKGKKALLVNFWFIHCGYCLLEMPELAGLYRVSKDLEIIAINDTDSSEEIRKFLLKSNFPYPIAMDTDGIVSGAFKLKDYGRPITYLIRPDRTIAYFQIGYDTENKLVKLKEELIKLGINQ